MPGVPEHGGGLALPGGLGAQPPAVGAEGGAGRAGASMRPPLGGTYPCNPRPHGRFESFRGLGVIRELVRCNTPKTRAKWGVQAVSTSCVVCDTLQGGGDSRAAVAPCCPSWASSGLGHKVRYLYLKRFKGATSHGCIAATT